MNTQAIGTTIADFFTGVGAVPAKVIEAVGQGFTGVGEFALSSPLIIIAFGSGLAFTGIKLIPKFIKMLRK